FFFFFISRSPPCSTLFPYTTLFRSLSACLGPVRCHVHLRTRDARGPRLVAGNRHRCARVSVLRFSLPFRLVPVSRNSPGQSHFQDRKSTRLNSSHVAISYAVFCLKK